MDNGKRCEKQKRIVYSLGERKIAFIRIFGALTLLSFPFAEDTFNSVWNLCLNSTEAGRVYKSRNTGCLRGKTASQLGMVIIISPFRNSDA